ncbi:MAG: cellulase family glycosylhydrolase [Candidatus Hydrogenedentes bacterium]|nr:cellulase family glycosylhydrolase [Candidatus Hydrogenedentota bacterium]
MISGGARAESIAELPEPTAAKLPRWRGFNLHSKFAGRNDKFDEREFALIQELGFNFVRLPMDYRGWVEPGDWTVFRESVLKEIDEAVGFGEKHGIHVQLNFHRAPGYTVAQPAEEKDLWKDEEAQRVCALHWAAFAKRYQGIPNRRLSFNLLNEPAIISGDVHRKVIERIVGEIRKEDASRLIVCDGRYWARTAPTELLGLGVAAATRGYEPMRISHHKAGWVDGADKWETPTYPLQTGTGRIDKQALYERNIVPWKDLEAKGVGVMVGEFGAHNQTPHGVVLAWLKDNLELWREAGWGWAQWCFTGSFGILDSERADVTYEEWNGHKLDRAMLDLLKAES